MTLQEFREKAFAFALAQGCDAAETYYAAGRSFTVNAQGGEIDRYKVSRKAGLSLRVQVDGRDGYAYTEAIEAPEQLVLRAMDNARCIETLDEHPMQGRCVYEAVEQTPHALSGATEERKIALALALERKTLAADPRIRRVVYCQVGTAEGHVEIHNTRGLAAVRDENDGYCYVVPLIAEGDEVKTGFALRLGREAAQITACAREAAKNAAEQLGASPVASGEYRVLLRAEAASDLLESFVPMFSADEAQKGCSLLANREGETIAAPAVDIVDDPFHPIAPRAFDGEGTPCVRKTLVERGVLKTLLHNLKTAQKAGVQSTGNAQRASAAAPLGVGPTVLYVSPGRTGYANLVRKLGDGLVIASLEGLHAGVDTISGDFSLKASGFLVRQGKIERPVSQITVAGNFLKLLSDTEAVGSDLKFRGSPVASPSLLLRGLMVAGE